MTSSSSRRVPLLALLTLAAVAVAPPMSSTTTDWELAAPIVRIAESCGAAATSSSPSAVTRWALSSGSCSMWKSMAPPYRGRLQAARLRAQPPARRRR